MFSVVRNVLKSTPAVTKCVTMPKANITTRYHVVALPNKNKPPLGERIILGSFILVVMWFTPVWVLRHINEYNGRPYRGDEP